MGVHGLWELLAPVGRRVSVETLAGKRLAVDASIWMIQFMKAMRDEKGDMVRNAHLIGFFRRICKLLYLRTKPVFVFDGGTPALKRRTVIARRRQRENAQAKIRKTAEKLLLNRLKDMKLKEQVENLKQQQKSGVKGKKLASDEPKQIEKGDPAGRVDVASSGSQQEKLDEMLAASIEVEKYGSLASGVDEVEKMFVKNDRKGKRVLLDGSDLANEMLGNPERDNAVLMKDYQEKLDEILAASIAAEEDGTPSKNASTSAAAMPSEEEASDEDEQMLLPAMHGNVDPTVLASLPPSVQLDLLVQMRERLMAENRQKYQKVKKAPEKFSEMQIQAYLKTVAFRRDIDKVQKAAAGRGVGGVQTSRIASEANREFIFSSSFDGDKEVLASARVEGTGEKQENTSQHSFAGSVKSATSLNKSDAAVELDMNQPRNPDEDIEVFIDERGRLRIRNRHMGIQMTRDIQRNLDLMKEKERATFSSVSNNDEMESAWENFPHEDQFVEPLSDERGESVGLSDRDIDSMPRNGSPIEISFEDNRNGEGLDDVDDIFVRLAAGEPMTISSADNNLKEESSMCASDSDWEEMPVKQKTGVSKLNTNSNDSKDESSPCALDSDWEEMPAAQIRSVSKVDAYSNNQNTCQDANNTGESKAEGEQTTCRDPNSSKENLMKRISKGYLEEEADLQEAIQRSLLELDGKKSESLSSERDVAKKSRTIYDEKNRKAGVDVVIKELTQHNRPFDETIGNVEEESTLDRVTVPKARGSFNDQPSISLIGNADGQKGITTLIDSCIAPCSENFGHDLNEERKFNKKMLHAKSGDLPENLLDVSNDSDELSTISKGLAEDGSHASGGLPVQLRDMVIGGETKNDSAKKDNAEGGSSIMLEDEEDAVGQESHSLMTGARETTAAAAEAHIQRSLHDTDLKQKSREEKTSSESAHELDTSANTCEDGVQVEFSEANLEEEILILGQEYLNLGDEQRRLERNAESVSSEMFAECQELLQIFGLPYIIAPMEAEAQCAFMELSNLVDGVVTDDSDVFLFGARSVYKNIFDDRKYVETYFMKDIEKELSLTREKLIHMALLLGSDYTEGVSGIGVVNAIEVVSAFPEQDGLQKFREWVESPDPTILGKTATKTSSNTKKRGSMSVDSDGASIDDTQEIKQIFMDKHRNVSKNWHIPATFPSKVVISAYSSPQVDRSTETFSWGKPDLLVLRKVCWEKFGWNSQKTDDLLLPVLKEYEKRETQLRMEAFYSFNERFAKIRSKRIKKAVKAITKNPSSEVTDDTLQEELRSRKKKRVAPPESGDNSLVTVSAKADRGEENQREVRKTRQNSKQERQSSTRSLEGNKRGRGRGRGRTQKRGRGQKDLVSKLSESSSDIDNGGDDFHEHHGVESGYLQKVRRSTRSRNPVKYNVKEDDESDKSPSSEEHPVKKQEDASAECGGEKHNGTAGTPINDCSSEGYFQTGGGFCADEAEPSTGCGEEPHLENKSADDYLMMGGGFCVDENEKVEDPDAAEKSADFTGEDLSGIPYSMDKPNNNRLQSVPQKDPIDAAQTQDHQTNESKDNCAGEETSTKENVETDARNSSAGALSAMPFLKRKRRRS